MISRAVLGLLGLFHLINGLWMLLAPEGWYAAVPGVTLEGPFNHHFIGDIGLAFIASGIGMMMSFRMGKTAAAFVLAGATWPTLHACFHVWEWVVDGLPSDPHILASTGIGVIVVSFLGFALAWMRAKQEGIV
ncbi:MAG: hypothetical protein JSR55_14710 [Proteobacteria bacterium]|nr:hypothetical protein [Pseudomonadota bacterium]